MRFHQVLPTCLLLMTLTAFVSCNTDEIKVEEVSNGVKLSCAGNKNVSGNGRDSPNEHLTYQDAHSGEYSCGDAKLFVKFRTCDNCIEMDEVAIAGMAVGDLVATAVIAVAVYLFASVIRNSSVTPRSKRSDRQLPAPREARGASNDPYERLRPNRPKDVYDELNRGR